MYVIGTLSVTKMLPCYITQHISSFVRSIFMIRNSPGSQQYGAITYLKIDTKYAHLNGLEKYCNFAFSDTIHSWTPCICCQLMLLNTN